MRRDRHGRHRTTQGGHGQARRAHDGGIGHRRGTQGDAERVGEQGDVRRIATAAAERGERGCGGGARLDDRVVRSRDGVCHALEH